MIRARKTAGLTQHPLASRNQDQRTAAVGDEAALQMRKGYPRDLLDQHSAL
jgi:hypothetical protein